MGTWGAKPWENDGAADWYSEFFQGIQADKKLDDAFQYSDDYEKIRAACYLLQTLGISYIWPGNLERLPEHMETGIEMLTRMIDPNDADMDYLELWDNDPEAIAEVETQIAQLNQRLGAGGSARR